MLRVGRIVDLGVGNPAPIQKMGDPGYRYAVTPYDPLTPAPSLLAKLAVHVKNTRGSDPIWNDHDIVKWLDAMAARGMVP